VVAHAIPEALAALREPALVPLAHYGVPALAFLLPQDGAGPRVSAPAEPAAEPRTAAQADPVPLLALRVVITGASQTTVNKLLELATAAAAAPAAPDSLRPAAMRAVAATLEAAFPDPADRDAAPTREVWGRVLAACGATLHPRVDKACDALVLCGPTRKAGSKEARAASLGVSLEDERWLLRRVFGDDVCDKLMT
jgi:hypothetical protein